jgi:hypothetical protein
MLPYRTIANNSTARSSEAWAIRSEYLVSEPHHPQALIDCLNYPSASVLNISTIQSRSRSLHDLRGYTSYSRIGMTMKSAGIYGG